MDELVEIAEKIIGDGVAEDRSSRSIARQVFTAISSSTTHRVVPVEPTEEMVDVLKAPIYGAVDMKSIQRSRESGLSLYAKLLAASPKVPQEGE